MVSTMTLANNARDFYLQMHFRLHQQKHRVINENCIIFPYIVLPNEFIITIVIYWIYIFHANFRPSNWIWNHFAVVGCNLIISNSIAVGAVELCKRWRL